MATQDSIQVKNFKKIRILFTAIISILILGLLLWKHVHGGVPSHHILAREDLPELSNWWGGLLLPFLTWSLLGRIGKRLDKHALSPQQAVSQRIRAIVILLLGLAFGVIVAVSFVNNYQFVLDNILYALIILSLIIPLYSSAFILGFVLAMTYTFGAILPLVFILIVAAFGFLMHQYIRPLLIRLTKRLSNHSTKKPEPLP